MRRRTRSRTRESGDLLGAGDMDGSRGRPFGAGAGAATGIRCRGKVGRVRGPADGRASVFGHFREGRRGALGHDGHPRAVCARSAAHGGLLRGRPRAFRVAGSHRTRRMGRRARGRHDRRRVHAGGRPWDVFRRARRSGRAGVRRVHTVPREGGPRPSRGPPARARSRSRGPPTSSPGCSRPWRRARIWSPTARNSGSRSATGSTASPRRREMWTATPTGACLGVHRIAATPDHRRTERPPAATHRG